MLLLLTDIWDVLCFFHVVYWLKEEEMKCDNIQLNVFLKTSRVEPRDPPSPIAYASHLSSNVRGWFHCVSHSNIVCLCVV